MSSDFFVKLPARGAVMISGDDRQAFLQGLITNDITLLDRQACVYSCLLSAQGRFLHDFFITNRNDTFYIECEGGERAQDLLAQLKKFKLRSKINIEAIDNIDVYVGTGDSPLTAFADPRHPGLGWRCYEPPSGVPAAFDQWDRHRISLGIPDGSRDMEVDRALMVENNIDGLNGLSYTKGCFIGQELTARMHHRNLGKKRLRVLQGITPFPAPGTELRHDERILGEMRSSCQDLGLAVLRDDALPLPEGAGFRLYGEAQPGARP